MALSNLTLTTLKPAQNPPPEELKIQNFSRGDRISVCSSGLSTFYLLPTGLSQHVEFLRFSKVNIESYF